MPVLFQFLSFVFLVLTISFLFALRPNGHDFVYLVQIQTIHVVLLVELLVCRRPQVLVTVHDVQVQAPPHLLQFQNNLVPILLQR